MSFSTVFWDLIFSATGFSKKQIEKLRSADEDAAPTPDVSDLLAPDMNWAAKEVIYKLRNDLQEYVDALRALKSENARRRTQTVKTKSFVEDKRYTALRAREAALHITPQNISTRFTELNLKKKGIYEISPEFLTFTKLEHFSACDNKLATVNHLPDALRTASFAGNQITAVVPSALAHCPNLLFLGLSCNKVQDISFLTAAPTLRLVDLSYNELCSVNHIVEVLSIHPSLKEASFIGNPCSLVSGYRCKIAQNTPLLVLDELTIEEEERVKSEQEAESHQVSLKLRIETLSGVLALVASSTPEPDSKSKSGGAPKEAKKSAKGGKDDATAPPVAVKRTTFVLDATWVDGQVAFHSDEIDSFPQGPIAPEDSSKGKGGKGPKATQEAQQAASDDIVPKIERTFLLEVASNLGIALMTPLVVTIFVNDISEGEEVETVTTKLGRFVFPLEALIKVEGEMIHSTAVLELDAHTLAVRERELNRMRDTMKEMIEMDKELDRQSIETPPTPIVMEDKTKKGGASAKQPGKPQSEEAARREQESASRKALIEEMNGKIQGEERLLSRWKAAAMKLSIAVARNPRASQEIPVAASVEVESKKDGKKKK